jgi:hypothetical protein
MLGELHSQELAAVDVGRAVVDALQLDVAVGVELGLLPLAHIERHGRQGLQSGFLDALEALLS